MIEGDNPTHPIRDILLRCMSSPDGTLVQASLQLFDVLLTTREEIVFRTLVLRNTDEWGEGVIEDIFNQG